MAQIFCTQCGQSASKKSNFCSACGNPLRSEVGSTEAEDQPPTSGYEKISSAPFDKSEDGAKLIKEHVDPVSQLTLFMSYLAASGIVLFLGIIVTFFDFWIGIAVVIGYLSIVGIVTYLTWSNFFYIVDDNSFQKQYGIFYKKNVTIPFDRIQNVNITRTFSDQMLGLARIDIETAGGTSVDRKKVISGSFSKAEGHIPGINVKKARELHDILLERSASSRQTGM